jgi:hypothetical protein
MPWQGGEGFRQWLVNLSGQFLCAIDLRVMFRGAVNILVMKMPRHRYNGYGCSHSRQRSRIQIEARAANVSLVGGNLASTCGPSASSEHSTGVESGPPTFGSRILIFFPGKFWPKSGCNMGMNGIPEYVSATKVVVL